MTITGLPNETSWQVCLPLLFPFAPTPASGSSRTCNPRLCVERTRFVNLHRLETLHHQGRHSRLSLGLPGFTDRTLHRLGRDALAPACRTSFSDQILHCRG